MTAIQNIHTPTIHIPTGLFRKAAAALLTLAGVALLVLAMTVAPGWSYVVALATSVVGVSLFAVNEQAKEAEKPQYDIR